MIKKLTIFATLGCLIWAIHDSEIHAALGWLSSLIFQITLISKK